MPLKDLGARKEYGRQQYLKNREKHLAYRKQYYSDNREKCIESTKRYDLKVREYYVALGEQLMPHKDPVARREYIKQHYLKNRENYLAGAKRQRAQPGYKEHMDPIKRRSMLKQRYGITDIDYLQILESQGWACAICKTAEPGNGHAKTFFDVDHDHITGKVRGLLCRDCNVTVGVVEKKTDKIKLIKDYLARHVEFDPEEPAPTEV